MLDIEQFLKLVNARSGFLHTTLIVYVQGRAHHFMQMGPLNGLYNSYKIIMTIPLKQDISHY